MEVLVLLERSLLTLFTCVYILSGETPFATLFVPLSSLHGSIGFLQFDSVTMTGDASKFLHGKWKTSRHLIFPVRIYSSWKLAAFTQLSFSRPAVSRVSWIRNIDVDAI